TGARRARRSNGRGGGSIRTPGTCTWSRARIPRSSRTSPPAGTHSERRRPGTRPWATRTSSASTATATSRPRIPARRAQPWACERGTASRGPGYHHLVQPSSVAEVSDALAAHQYVADEGLATAIFLALRLGRPLLLEGEAGVGKTEVAKVLSRWTGGELLRLQ